MRDAALARVRRTRRWVIAGAAAFTAGFAGLVSAVAPGRSLSASSKKFSARAASPSTTAAVSTIPRMPAPAGAGDLGLQSPSQGPTPSQSQSQPQQQQAQPQQQSQPQPAPQPQPQSVPAAPPAGGVVSGGS